MSHDGYQIFLSRDVMICYVSKFLNVIYRIYHFPIDSEPNKILFISESTEKWYLQSDFELIYQD